MNSNALKDFEALFIDGGRVWAVDPALRNFSLSNAAAKVNVRIDFGTPLYFFRCLPDILRCVLKSGSIIFGERQINKHRNPNVRHEFFMRGVIAALGTTRYVDVPAHGKARIAADQLEWAYEKCASKKAFVRACNASNAIRQASQTWKCYHLTVKTGQLAKFKSPLDQKKFDDFVDTLVLLSYPAFAQKKTTRNKKQPPKAKSVDARSAAETDI